MAAKRRGKPAVRPLGGVTGPQQVQERDGRTYYTRPIPGQSATKTYTCPRCLGTIVVGEPHMVVWPADESDGIRERRHWHTRCWRR
jgi:hypothetical protein